MIALLLSVSLAAPPPTVPKELEPLKARIGGNFSTRREALSFTAAEPPTESQWKAIESVKPKAVAATGRGIDDAALAQLAKLPLEALALQHARPTDAGAAAFAEMRGLKLLVLSHCTLTGKAADFLANHPSLESFADDGALGGEGMAQIASCKKLRFVQLVHGAANDSSAASLAGHNALERLELIPSNTYGVTDESLASIAGMPHLKDLVITHSVLSYEGGLKRLKALTKLESLSLTEVAIADGDLAKLKADLPAVKLVHSPMSAPFRRQWDRAAAIRAKNQK